MAINNSFSAQKNSVIFDIRQLVECWGSGKSLAWHQATPCACHKHESEYCGKSWSCKKKHSDDSHEKCDDSHGKCDDSHGKCDDEKKNCHFDTVVAVATLEAIFGQFAKAPNTQTSIDGSLLLQYFNSLLDLIQTGLDVKIGPFAPQAGIYTVTYKFPPSVVKNQQANTLENLECLINEANSL